MLVLSDIRFQDIFMYGIKGLVGVLGYPSGQSSVDDS